MESADVLTESKRSTSAGAMREVQKGEECTEVGDDKGSIKESSDMLSLLDLASPRANKNLQVRVSESR